MSIAIECGLNVVKSFENVINKGFSAGSIPVTCFDLYIKRADRESLLFCLYS